MQKNPTIVMTGASGFVGSYLAAAFEKQGWTNLALTRSDFDKPEYELLQKIRQADVVINLAGAPIIARWSEDYKKIIYQSRISVTQKLVSVMAKTRPRLFISTSAVGYYDSQGRHTEKNFTRADNFLGKVTADWEQAALRAQQSGIRTVIFRFGVVLAPNGGPLKKMLWPFRLGLGGNVGNGQQAFSWVHIDDLVKAYLSVIQNQNYQGIYNLTAPGVCSNAALTQTLAQKLRRPAFLHVPKWFLYMTFGEGSEVLTDGQYALPQRLLDEGFQFDYPDLSSALQQCLAKK